MSEEYPASTPPRYRRPVQRSTTRWTTGSATTFRDARGALTPLELGGLIAAPARFFWIRDVPEGATRAGHAHRTSTELVVVLTGSVAAIVVDPDGTRSRVELRTADWLLLPPAHMLTLECFAPDTVLGVLATGSYDRDEMYSTE